jgi:nicotinamidase-related amidase
MNASGQALLVIDVQRGLFDGAVPQVGVPFEADAVVDRINGLAAQARSAGASVFWVQHERAEGFLSHGSPEWELHPGLKTDSGDARIFKTTPDSFLRTGLQRLLESRGVKELVICGYASEFCVDTTTRRAAALGYAVTLVADAHTTADKPHATGEQIRAHENATLPALTSFGPKIRALPSAEVMNLFAS